MSLSDMLRETADDVVAAATPLVARRFSGPRRVAVAEGEALAIYEIGRDGAPKLVRGPGEKPSGRAAPDQGELRLPADIVLARTLSFPAATRGFLEPVLDHRLEKLTPWAPDRVVYGYRVTEEAADGALTVAFAATARNMADAWIARAAAAGFTPTAVGSAAEPLGEPLAIDLFRGRLDSFRPRVRRLLGIAALIAVAIPLPLCAASFWMLSEAETRLQAVEARSTAARDTLRLAAGGGGRETALLAEKRPETAVMTLIDRLSTAIPDGTVLRELEVDPERVRLSGASTAAPELIGVLEKSGAVGGVRFGAPVTRNAEGRDGFEILANRNRPSPTEPARP